MEYEQLRSIFIIPVLQGLGLYSQEAESLMVGTFAQESECGKYVKQINGPALSYWGIQPSRHDEIVRAISVRVPQFSITIQNMCKFSKGFDSSLLLDNIRYACCFARMHYWLINEPIPKSLEEQAKYWKKYYNSEKGKGTEEEYISSYLKYTGNGKSKDQDKDQNKDQRLQTDVKQEHHHKKNKL